MKTKKWIYRTGFLLWIFSGSSLPYASGQEEGLKAIDIEDLQAHMKFLSSDELAGRATADSSILVAAEYIAGELQKLNIKTIDDNKDYYQNYTLINSMYDWDRCRITIRNEDREIPINTGEFYLFPFPEGSVEITGEVVFGGYGISEPGQDFDEYSGVDVTDKVVIVMDGAPLDDEGNSRIENVSVSGYFRFFSKAMAAQRAGAKAVLYVYPPNSEYGGLLDEYPNFGSYITGSIKLKGDEGSGMNFMSGYTTKLIMADRNVAEHLLEGSGTTLESLQEKIDEELKPVSFTIPGISVTIRSAVTEKHLEVPNVVGFIEGSDPELKNEVIIYSAHFDHIGAKDEDNIFNGADDNASGSTAMLELAEAYSLLPVKPKRSIILLWVSGEEIGLFGSRYYSENPLISLDNTVVNLNMDMIGRVKSEADTGASIHMTTRESLFVIGGHQSSELMEINNNVFEKQSLTPDYSLNDRDHPERLYYRSDHINFASKDVPVLFFSTGIHTDYHTVRDTYDKIDFDKLYAVTKLVFILGYEIANRPQRISVDNPYSSWGR